MTIIAADPRIKQFLQHIRCEPDTWNLVNNTACRKARKRIWMDTSNIWMLRPEPVHLLFFLPRILLSGEHGLHQKIEVSSPALYYTMV